MTTPSQSSRMAAPFSHEELKKIWNEAVENRRRLDACLDHRFEPCPDWLEKPLGSTLKAVCENCRGQMPMNELMSYLLGRHHERSTFDYKGEIERIFPGKSFIRDGSEKS